jgi:hypothetical protein
VFVIDTRLGAAVVLAVALPRADAKLWFQDM